MEPEPATPLYALSYLNAKASAGPGHEMPEHELVVSQVRVSAHQIQQFGNISGIPNLRLLTAYGDSMLPTFNDGDILIVDTGKKAADIDGVYVLRAQNRLFVKRVRQRAVDGVFEISSDNPSAGKPEELSGKQQVEILGKVVWAWNGKRL